MCYKEKNVFDSKRNGKFLKAIGECMWKICALLPLGTCYENMELGSVVAVVPVLGFPPGTPSRLLHEKNLHLSG